MDFCQCMHFHRPHSLPKDQWLGTRAERGVASLALRAALEAIRRRDGGLVEA